MKKKFKKILKKSLIVLPVLLFLTAYAKIPEEVTLIEGEGADFGWGLVSRASTESPGEFETSARLFNLIPIKTVDVSVMPKTYLIPSGEAIGVKIYTDGLLVVGISDVISEDGKIFYPARDAGIKVGDRIVKVNGEKVLSIDDFSEKINLSKEKAKICVDRDGNTLELDIYPISSKDSMSYKVGLWVKDSTAGIGTLTYYSPKTGFFGALGHGICDSDTKELMTVKKGSINGCDVKCTIKGGNGVTGELSGDFYGSDIGDIQKNTEHGIFGRVKMIPEGTPLLVASGFEVEKGPAVILCDVDGGGPSEYEIEITKISHREDGKNMVLKVTDQRLIRKTGGIVQGMSGSPILQNGKFVGAVTHVFVNDPTRGYGIFIENMLSEE